MRLHPGMAEELDMQRRTVGFAPFLAAELFPSPQVNGGWMALTHPAGMSVFIGAQLSLLWGCSRR